MESKKTQVKYKIYLVKPIGLLLVLSAIMNGAVAQEKDQSNSSSEASAADAAVQANNPLASIKTFNFHNYYVPKLSGLPDETSNTMWLRYAQPIGRFLVRASLPLSTVPWLISQISQG